VTEAAAAAAFLHGIAARQAAAGPAGPGPAGLGPAVSDPAGIQTGSPIAAGDVIDALPAAIRGVREWAG
jgi:hypothetical protein